MSRTAADARPPGREVRASPKRWRSRRLRALLAAGLVLGIGSSMTVAAWTDEDHARGTITSGTFVLEGNGGQGFEVSSAENPRTLTFAPSATAMLPSQETYALYRVRTSQSSVAGSLQFQGAAANSGPLGEHLRYGVRIIADGATCNATSFSNSTNIVVATTSTLATGSSTTQTVSAAGASVANYCIRLTLPSTAPNSAQGQQATPRWVVQGTSVSG